MLWCDTPADILVHSSPAPPVSLDQQEQGRASMVVQEVLNPPAQWDKDSKVPLRSSDQPPTVGHSPWHSQSRAAGAAPQQQHMAP